MSDAPRLTYRAYTGKGKVLMGEVKFGDLDISNRVSALTFRHSASGASILRLDIPLYGEDEIVLDVPADLVKLRPRR